MAVITPWILEAHKKHDKKSNAHPYSRFTVDILRESFRGDSDKHAGSLCDLDPAADQTRLNRADSGPSHHLADG